MRVRRVQLSVGAAVTLGAIATVIAGSAWACTNFIRIDRLAPATEAGVASVTVQGSGAKSNAPIELRWNALKGEVVGRAQADASGTFTAIVDAPAAPSGIYTLIASDGQTPVGRAAFEVASRGADTAAIQPVDVESHSPSPVQVGVALLALGLVALMSASTVLAVRRRRVLAVA